MIFFIVICFITNLFCPPVLLAQQPFYLPPPGTMTSLSQAFTPIILKGIRVHSDNPFLFDFILDNGNTGVEGKNLKNEATKLIKYFLTSLTTPENDMWVNLSPYEKDRIVPEKFGETGMGRDLLAQDYLLKQLTASLLYPENKLGKIFWDKVYDQAYRQYGTTDIPVDTFNKVWIVTDKAVVYENSQNHSAFVTDSHLKVMLEEDYLTPCASFLSKRL